MSVSLATMLQLSIILPLATVVGIVAAGHRENIREAISLGSGILLLYLVFNLYVAVEQGKDVSGYWWEILPDLHLGFSVEPLGVLFALVASFLWIVTTMYSIGYMRANSVGNQTRFYAFFSISIGCVMGIAFADNLLTLFVFYELLTLCTYPLVTHSQTQKARDAGRTYFGVLFTTSIVFFLLAMVSTWLLTGTLNFTLGGVFGAGDNTLMISVLLIFFVLGISKAAIMPFHRWLPAAMVAPAPVSALLHAVAVVKAGVFTILKVSIFIFGIDLVRTLPATQVLLYLAGFSVLFASLIAMRQDNLKARLAYSTVSQLGYVTIGALLASSMGVVASAMHIAVHAFGKITLFFCAGAIMTATGKSKVSELQGVGFTMPITMVAFFIASLSIIGLPPAGGTWSKWFLLMGVVETQQWVLMIVLMISSLLNIAYLLPIPYRAFVSKDDRKQVIAVKEAPLASLMAICITAVCCLALFIYPDPLHELALSILDKSGGVYGQ